jgi:exonuclease VII large subunit
VERQLAELQLALHVNVGPRRQALEHLRSLIEQQNHRIDTARSAFKKAKQEMEHWQRAMEEAQQRKEQLAAELTTLVQQSAGAQLRKLEQLSDELDHLTADLPPEEAAANGARLGGNSQGPAPAAGPAVQPRPMATQPQPPQQQTQQTPTAQQPAAAPAPSKPTDEEQEAQRRHLQLERQRQAAAAARGRHVQLGRKPSGGAVGATAAAASSVTSGSRQPQSGPFQGFD